MGKSIPSSATRLQDFAKVISSDRIRQRPAKHKTKPIPKTQFVPPPEPTKPLKGLRLGSSNQQQQRILKMEESSSSDKESTRRIPLAEMVKDCTRRWFQETLKEAKSGNRAMQVLVGQMYSSGYGVPRDAYKGRAWIRASELRTSLWEVGDKPPGYGATDSDSDDAKANVNLD